MSSGQDQHRDTRLAVRPGLLSERSRQSWGAPPQWWEDERFTCRDCGRECRFSARQKRQWYEIEKRDIWERPVRCLTCHRARRRAIRAKSRMDTCLAALQEHPRPDAITQALAAIVAYHRLTGAGDLQRAIALYRALPPAFQTKAAPTHAYRYCRQQLRTKAAGHSTPASPDREV